MAGKGRFPLVSALGCRFRCRQKTGHPAQSQIAFRDRDTTESTVWRDWFFEAAASAVSGTATIGQGAQTVAATGLESLAGTSVVGQGNQTAISTGLESMAGTATIGQGAQSVGAAGEVVENLSGPGETGQGGQTSVAFGQTTGEQPAPAPADPRLLRRYPVRVVGSGQSGQGAQSTTGVARVVSIGAVRGAQSQTMDAAGRLAVIGRLAGAQRQTQQATGTVDRFARAKREDELWLLAA